jgi:hypothetical protein
MAPQLSEPPSWWRLHDRLQQIARERDAQASGLAKLRGNLVHPERVLPPLPEPPPIWLSLPVIPKGAPAQLKRKLRRQRTAAAKKALKRMLPADELPASATDRLCREMRYFAALYVQEQLIEHRLARGTLSRRALHDLCREILRDAIEPDTGGLARAAPGDFRGMFHLDRRGLIWQLMHALAAQAKALLKRKDGGGGLWFPLTVATVPEKIESEMPAEAPAADLTPEAPPAENAVLEPEPIAPVEPEAASERLMTEPLPAKRKAGRPRKQETDWSRLLAKRIAELSTLLAPEKAVSQEELAILLHINPRELYDLDKLDPANERRCRVEKELMQSDLADKIRNYRADPSKSALEPTSPSINSPNSSPNS